MYYPEMNKNKLFKDKKTSLTFDKQIMVSNRNVLDKDNTRVTALPILNENRKTMIFKVLGSVIY